MLKENISLTQLLCLIINFLLGSAIVMGVGSSAKQDAWIAISIATLIGTGIIYFYYSLNNLLPNKNFFEIMEYCLTRPFAIFFSFGYITYFLYISSRIIRDFEELISSAILPTTPMGVISFSMMLLIAYILYLGLEVLGRISEIFTPYILGFLLLVIFFLVLGGKVEWHNIQPFLGEGVKPVIKALFPSLMTFPFGELITFTVILSSVTPFKKAKKIAIMGVLLAGCILTITSLLFVFTLGAGNIQYVKFPLLSAARIITIGDFIERIDPLVVFIMMLGVLVKSSIFLYVGLKGLEYVFRVPYRYFTVPISIMVSALSMLISNNFADHVEKGLRFTIYYLHPPIQFAIPTMLLVILLWKTKKKNLKKVEKQS